MFLATVECDGEALLTAAQVTHFTFNARGESAGRFLIDDANEDHGQWVQFMNWDQGPNGQCRLLTDDGRSAPIVITKRKKSTLSPLTTEVDFVPNTALE